MQANGHGNLPGNGHSNLLGNHSNYPTNCSNVSTLSDLKKFRNDLRHRNYTSAELKEAMIGNELYNGKAGKFSEVDGLANRFDGQNGPNYSNSNYPNQNYISHQNSQQPPANSKLTSKNNNYLNQSPNSTMKKFRGDPSDMIGEIQKRKCCSMM